MFFFYVNFYVLEVLISEYVNHLLVLFLPNMSKLFLTIFFCVFVTLSKKWYREFWLIKISYKER